MNDPCETTQPHGIRFSLTALLTSVFVIGVALGWWADRTNLQQKLDRSIEAAMFGKLKLLEDLQRSECLGVDVTAFPEVLKFADNQRKFSRESSSWDQLAKGQQGEVCEGRECIVYYFRTAIENREGILGFDVVTVDGNIVSVNPVYPLV
jgi:hypothetical protein